MAGSLHDWMLVWALQQGGDWGEKGVNPCERIGCVGGNLASGTWSKWHGKGRRTHARCRHEREMSGSTLQGKVEITDEKHKKYKNLNRKDFTADEESPAKKGRIHRRRQRREGQG